MARASRSKDNKKWIMSGKGAKIEPEFKAISTTSEDKSEGTKNGRIFCYVCGGNGAKWSLYCKENEAEKSPYFPFLQSIDKAEGALPIRSNGRIDACTLCFSFLVQQWRSYEESNTPISKRTYWLKRSGPVNNDTLNLNEEKFSNSESDSLAGKSHETVMESGINLESINDDKSLGNNCLDLSGLDKTKREMDNKGSSDELLSTTLAHQNEDGKLEKENKESKSMEKEIEDREGEELCCSCGEQAGSTLLKTVHTKPQLKTETPFYPFLAQRSHDVDFMGRVRVCKGCKIYLFKQWDKYEKLHMPLSERYYTLPSAYDLQKEVKSDLFICFLCGENHPKTSMRDVRAMKGNTGMPYYPFLLRRLPPAGATEDAEAGVFKVCECCRKSLTNQWNAFEDAGLAIHDRVYKAEKGHESKNNVVPSVLPTMHACLSCKKIIPRGQLDCNYGKEESAIVSDTDHQTFCLECKKAFKQHTEASNHVTCEKPIESSRKVCNVTTAARMSVKNDWSPVGQSTTASSKILSETCFLCGERVNALNLEYLYVFPRQYVNGFRPFFPSLAYRVPAYHAKPPSASGTVITCMYCHGNMINQWYECEKHEQHGISNPWVRQYIFSQFTCYLCSKVFPRQKITMVSSTDFPFLTKVRRPVRGFRINNRKDYVVCQHCKEIIHVQKENFDKCRVDVSERDYELPMVQFDSNLANKVSPNLNCALLALAMCSDVCYSNILLCLMPDNFTYQGGGGCWHLIRLSCCASC